MTTLNSSIDLLVDVNAGSYANVPSTSKAASAKSIAAWWTYRRQLFLMWSCVAITSAVSMYDVYWSFKTQYVLAETEQNPIGTALIELDGGDIALFMTVKMLGTMAVILALPALFFFRRHWGLASCISVAMFQVCLFGYLNFGHLLNN